MKYFYMGFVVAFTCLKMSPALADCTEVRSTRIDYPDYVTSVQFNQDATRALTGVPELMLWNAETARQIRPIGSPGASYSSALLSPDGNFVLTTTRSVPTNELHVLITPELWNANTGALIARFPSNNYKLSYPRFIAKFSADSSVLGYGYVEFEDNGRHESHLEFLNTNNLTSLGHVENSEQPLINSITISPDNRLMAASHHHPTANGVWDIRTGRKLVSLPNSTGEFTFSSDGSKLFAFGKDGGVEVRSAADGNLIHTVAPGQRSVGQLRMHANRSSFAFFNRDTLETYDVSTGSLQRRYGLGQFASVGQYFGESSFTYNFLAAGQILFAFNEFRAEVTNAQSSLLIGSVHIVPRDRPDLEIVGAAVDPLGTRMSLVKRASSYWTFDVYACGARATP